LPLATHSLLLLLLAEEVHGLAFQLEQWRRRLECNAVLATSLHQQLDAFKRNSGFRALVIAGGELVLQRIIRLRLCLSCRIVSLAGD